MKKNRKARKEAVKRLEMLEEMNRDGKQITMEEFIGALYPNFLSQTQRTQETGGMLLQEVKSLIDIKDYISCPKSREKKAIHIGDIVYEVDGDGEPLTVVKIIVRHDGAVVQCRYTNFMETNRENYLIRRSTKLSFFPRELTFDKPVNDGLYSELNKLWGKSCHVIVVEEN